MSERIVRIRIRETLYKRYKVLCAMNDMSMPKQTEDIIRNFIKSNEKIEIPYDIIEKIGNK